MCLYLNIFKVTKITVMSYMKLRNVLCGLLISFILCSSSLPLSFCQFSFCFFITWVCSALNGPSTNSWPFCRYVLTFLQRGNMIELLWHFGAGCIRGYWPLYRLTAHWSGTHPVPVNYDHEQWWGRGVHWVTWNKIWGSSLNRSLVRVNPLRKNYRSGSHLICLEVVEYRASD